MKNTNQFPIRERMQTFIRETEIMLTTYTLTSDTNQYS